MSAKLLKDKPNSFSGEWLSVSKVKTFKDCPAKYRYTYIEKLPRKSWEFQVLGQFAHSSLENLLKTAMFVRIIKL